MPRATGPTAMERKLRTLMLPGTSEGTEVSSERAEVRSGAMASDVVHWVVVADWPH